jgi:hypothetical protein
MSKTKHHSGMFTFSETARLLNEVGFKITTGDLKRCRALLDFPLPQHFDGLELLPWAETLEWAQSTIPKRQRVA